MELRSLARSLGITDELYGFKAEFLDRSYWIISVYWRVVLKYFQNLPIEHADGTLDNRIDPEVVRKAAKSIPAITVDEIQSCIEDVRLLEMLDKEEHQKLFRVRLADFECPTELDLVPIITKLRRFCHWLAARRLRFIAKYDASVTMADLTDELFEAALITLRNYDHEYTNATKVYNFARMGVQNHCVLMQQYHTRQRRGRIVKVTVNNQTEFASTTVSLDQPLEGSSISLGDVMPDEGKDPDRQFAERQWLCSLLRKIPQDVGRVVKITLGDHDPEFSSWLESQGTEIGNLSDTTLTRKACQFCGIPLKRVKVALRRTGQIQMVA
jgi:integrase